MANVFYISDLHLGHKNILKFREGFNSVEEHDQTIHDNILATVGKRDSLWILGDTAFSDEGWDRVKDISDKVGHLNLILGNHELENKKRTDKFRELYNQGTFHNVQGFCKHKEFWLSHCPIHPMELRGKKNLHGHMHNERVNDVNYLSVCCEWVDYRPIDLNEVRRRFTANKEAGGILF